MSCSPYHRTELLLITLQERLTTNGTLALKSNAMVSWVFHTNQSHCFEQQRQTQPYPRRSEWRPTVGRKRAKETFSLAMYRKQHTNAKMASVTFKTSQCCSFLFHLTTRNLMAEFFKNLKHNQIKMLFTNRSTVVNWRLWVGDGKGNVKTPKMLGSYEICSNESMKGHWWPYVEST